jgi:hypothetical protein
MTDGLVNFMSKGDGEVVRLGVWTIGEIVVTSQCGIVFRLALPELTARWFQARSRQEAREKINARVADWIDAAGLAPASPAEGALRAWHAPDVREVAR